MPRRLLLALMSCALLVPTLSGAADPAAPVPLDPAVITGTLPNGLRYFVRPNAKPEQRADVAPAAPAPAANPAPAKKN